MKKLCMVLSFCFCFYSMFAVGASSGAQTANGLETVKTLVTQARALLDSFNTLALATQARVLLNSLREGPSKRAAQEAMAAAEEFIEIKGLSSLEKSERLQILIQKLTYLIELAHGPANRSDDVIAAEARVKAAAATAAASRIMDQIKNPAAPLILDQIIAMMREDATSSSRNMAHGAAARFGTQANRKAESFAAEGSDAKVAGLMDLAKSIEDTQQLVTEPKAVNVHKRLRFKSRR